MVKNTKIWEWGEHKGQARKQSWKDCKNNSEAEVHGQQAVTQNWAKLEDHLRQAVKNLCAQWTGNEQEGNQPQSPGESIGGTLW